MKAFWLAASRSMSRSGILASAALPLTCSERFGNRPAQRGDRVAQPLQVHFLAAEHLLIAVVRVVGRDRPRVGLPRLEQLERVSMELVEERQQLGGAHEFCFALQVMQTRVHGMAFSLASAIGSPQSRQTP